MTLHLRIVVAFLTAVILWDAMWWAIISYVIWDISWLSRMSEWERPDRAMFLFWFFLLALPFGVIAAGAINLLLSESDDGS